jgi:acetyl-CoA acetyltransferase/uncharacterized OB-fold protein
MMGEQGPIRPAVTQDTADFWAGCQEGVLRFPRCDDCGWIVHPPRPVCAACRSRSLTPAVVAPEGIIESFTISHTSFRPDLPAPYALAIVQLAEAPEVRLTTRVVNIDTDAVAIGLAVRFVFERIDDDLTLPLVEPSGASHEIHHAEPGQLSFAAHVGDKPEERCVIAGIGRSAVGRKLLRSDLDLTIDAALAAIADAGLDPSAIDGIAAYPGAGIGPPGYAGPQTDEVADALGLQLAWHRAGAEGAGQLQPLFDAVLAVAAGLCDHALVYRTSTESSVAAWMRDGTVKPPAATDAGGFLSWLLPFDSITAAHWLAPYATAHQHRFGTTREQLGAIAVNARANAARTPGAVFTEPLTMPDYLGSRPISTPLCLFDCDVPVDGSVAVVVSRSEHAAALDHPAVRVEAMGTGVGFRPSWDQWPDLTTMASVGAAATMWARTDLRPTDIDVAELYDGFTFLALTWLEALGFCAHGDGGAFVEGGARIARDGAVPLSTDGGQLSFGRLHGWGLLYEACQQLRGEADDRQVASAETAVVSTGGGPIAGCVLLTR